MKRAHLEAQKIKEIPAPVIHRLEETRKGVFARFPLLFTLLGAFGVVATFYGFEGIIDQISVLKDNPVTILFVGILTLVLTGSLYKKLG